MCGQYFIDAALDHSLVQGVAMGFVVAVAHCVGEDLFVRLALGVTEGPAGSIAMTAAKKFAAVVAAGSPHNCANWSIRDRV